MCNLGVLSDLNVKKIAYLVSGDCLYTTSWELFKTLLKPDQAYGVVFFTSSMHTECRHAVEMDTTDQQKIQFFLIFLNSKFVQTETLLPSEWAMLSLKKIIIK